MEAYCITVSEMGKRLCISRASAYNLANRADFYPAIRLGKRLLINTDALHRWLNEQTKSL